MAKARQPSLLLVAVSNAGAGVAAVVDLGGGVPDPDEVPPLVLPPPVDDDVPPVPEVVPVPVVLGGGAEPPDVLVAGGVLVPPELLLEGGALVLPELLVEGGVVVLPEVLVAGGADVLPVLLLGADPLAVLSVVEPEDEAELLEPQALSAARQAIEITERIETRGVETKIIATLFHSLPSDRRGKQVTRHN